MDARHAHEIHPEDYYMSREVEVEIPQRNPQGKITGFTTEIHTVWDVEVQVETGYPAGTAVLTRRCKWVTQPDPEEYVHGYQRIEASPDTVAVRAGAELHLIDWIYQTWVHGEIWNETFSYWERPLPVTKESHVLYDPDDPERVIGCEYIADYGGGNYLKTIVNYNWFTGFPNKYTYELYWPGAKKRVYTQTQVYNEDHFNLDLSDFDGPYDLTPSAGLINITYYPDGVTEDYCIVDPYLGVDEQANWIDVTCDGFIFRLYSGAAGNTFYDFRNLANNSSRIRGQTYFSDGTTAYYPGYDQNRATDILENTPTRVVLRSKGGLDSDSGAGSNFYPNVDYIIFTFYIYLDRVVIEVEVEAVGAVTVSSWDFGAWGQSSLTGRSNINEDSGSEVAGPVSGTVNAATYWGWTADEMNTIIVKLSEDGFADNQVFSGNGIALLRQSDDLTAGTYKVNYIIVTDPVEREGAAKIYDVNDRLAMGEQYNDPILDQAPSKGDDITDMIIPARIASGTLHSDGAHFYEPDVDAAVKIALDRTRIRPSFVIRDFPFQSGLLTAPVDHLSCHLKCDENQASPILNDETANNAHGTWSNISNGSSRDTNTPGDSVLDSIRGRALDTQDGLGFIQMQYGAGTPHDNAFFQRGSMLISLKPQFTYDDVIQRVFDFGITAANYIQLRYDAASDRWILVTFWGGTSVSLNGTIYTNNDSLQKYITFLISWNADNNFILLGENGQAVSVAQNTGTPTTAQPLNFVIGCQTTRASPTDAILDEIKTFNDCILPYGGFFTDEQSDFANPHADITAFVKGDESNGSPLKVGTGNVVESGVTNVEDVRGQAGGALEFDAGSDVFEIPNTNIDLIKGAIGFWYRATVTVSAFASFVCGDTFQQFALFRNGSDTQLLFYFNNVQAIYSNVLSVFDGLWHFIKLDWNVNTNLRTLSIDSISYPPNTDAITSPIMSNNLTIGRDQSGSDPASGAICEFTITNDPNTPEIWTAFGKPLHVPLVDKT